MQRRWRRWGVGFTVLVLIGASAVFFGGGFFAGGQRAAAASVAPFVVVAGRPVPYDRPQAWTSASISARTSRALSVFAAGSTDAGGDYCGEPVLRFRVTETPKEVAVLVANYQAPAGLTTGCAGVGYSAAPNLVRLQQPLGTRTVVDASTGHAVGLLIGSEHPNLPATPHGMTATPLAQQEPSGPVSRNWFVKGDFDTAAISVSDQAPASVRNDGPYGRVALQAEIRGTPATVYQDVGGAPGAWFVQWTPNARQTITLRVAAAGSRHWNAASTLALARTVTGYATVASDRLGEPSVAGTVAATYNSADGPVQGATNLLKSSGVYVGLDCRGPGRLTVTIRTASTTVDCTTELEHHSFENTGSPNAAFPLTVEADSGVHWSLSVARASLDGS